MMGADQLMALFLSLCGVIVALGAAVVAIPRIYRAFIACSKFVATVNWAVPQLLVIVKEMKPNGGHSIKDQMNTIEATIKNHTARFDKQDETLGSLLIKTAEQDEVLQVLVADNVSLKKTAADVKHDLNERNEKTDHA